MNKMVTEKAPTLSVVVPVYNEAAGLKSFHDSLTAQLNKLSDKYEVIYCDDGSNDGSLNILRKICAKPYLKLLSLSRNFGKEIATTAGIHAATGQAILTIDADGQHPVELIPEFIKRWQQGNLVVVGLRESNSKEGWIKRFGSKLFYWLFNRLAHRKLVPNTTDFRLIDGSVQAEFKRMTEHNRITRSLIDWVGYQPDYVRFKANARQDGAASYSTKKLTRLAVDSIISSSTSPLYIMAYVGLVVMPLAALLGLFMIINFLLGDPASLHPTGSAYLVVLLLFLVGLILLAQGLIGLYLSHIHTETQNRPLYVVDQEASIGVGKTKSA